MNEFGNVHAYEPKIKPDTPHVSKKRKFQLQSDIVIDAAQSTPQVTGQETTQFIDENSGLDVGLDESYDGISAMDGAEAIGLAQFLSRPVRIASYTWRESDAVGTTTTIKPWSLFFGDSRIKHKLNNFAFLQAKLKVKVLINASPFYYGATLGTYQPLQSYTPSTIKNDAGTRYFIPLSQRPHMWIYPQECKGDTMTLPFFYYKNWLNALSLTDLENMGELKFINFTTLRSANGASGVGVSVQVYAWAEDIKVAGPTVGLALQSGDEYGNGVISAPASAIASGAKWFENIPIIGRFATATRIGASAVSAIASLFGWTNVPVLSNTEPVRPSPFPRLAATDIGYPTEKLTLDSKNELTVDPSVLGLPAIDELAIGNLASRESYLTTAMWDDSDIVDDILFSSRVNPTLYDAESGFVARAYMTPVCWVAQLFKHWRGDIIFRFKFVASPYHKGRVRISYDPSGTSGQNIVTDATSQTVVMTQIVDLGVDSDIEIRVPYQQATAFQQVRNDITSSGIPFSTSGSPSWSYNALFDNGFITMRVQTNLTGPVAGTSVPVLVFVRAAENFEVANPTDLQDATTFNLQSGDVYGKPMPLIAGTSTKMPHPDLYLINFGENIKSLRKLMRRQSLSFVSQPVIPGVADNSLYVEKLGRIPPYLGYDPNGIHQAVGLLEPIDTFKFNYCNNTPINWVAPAFIGMRGSIQWTINVDGKDACSHMRVYRDTTTIPSAAYTQSYTETIGPTSRSSRFYKEFCKAGVSGSALTNQRTNAGLSVQLPMYSKYRFQTTEPGNATALSIKDESAIDSHIWEYGVTRGLPDGSTVDKAVKIWHYVGIGTDFNLFHFLNVPTVRVFVAMPADGA